MQRDLEKDECKFILSRNYIGQLAYVYQNKPFTVPITYFFKDDKIICYSGYGHKVTAMRLNDNVSIQVTELDEVKKWKSAMAHGKYKELDGANAKAYLHDFSLGVKDIIKVREQKELDYINEFSAKVNEDEYPIIFTIEIYEYTGRMMN